MEVVTLDLEVFKSEPKDKECLDLIIFYELDFVYEPNLINDIPILHNGNLDKNLVMIVSQPIISLVKFVGVKNLGLISISDQNLVATFLG